MSDWSGGRPDWAPTPSEIQSWEAPAGVSRGRGFAPAGRGRGIAKWSSQDDKPVGRSRRSNSLEIPESRGRREQPNHRTEERRHHQEGGGDRRFDSNSKESPKCYRCEGIGHLSYECPSRKKYEERRPDPRREERRHNEGDRRHHEGERRHQERNGDRRQEGSSRDSLECYRCDGIGHLSYDCASRKKREDGRPEGHRKRDSGVERIESNGHNGDSGVECYSCGGQGHIAHNCPDKGRGRYEDKGREKKEECYNCGELGHIARNCTTTTNGQQEPKGSYVPGQEDPEEELFQHGVSSGINFKRYENIDVKVTGSDVKSKVSSFESAKLHPILMKNIMKSEYQMPTPVQKHAIPNIMSGRDIMACAQTGSGKTAAFLIPVIHLLLEQGVEAKQVAGNQAPQVVVISPTRELAVQIKDEARKFSSGSNLRAVVAYGGTNISHQAGLIKDGCNILIATPGRLLDFIDRGIVSLLAVKYLILDEADRMLDMGFKDDINRLVRNPEMPGNRDRNTLMFSATFPDNIQRMASEFMREYLFISVGLVGGACQDVTQSFHQVSQFEKREKLLEVVSHIYDNTSDTNKSLVFVEMKKTADFIASYMCQSGFPTTSIHGDRLQKEREEALDDFKCGRKPVLVATAVAARGLDIKHVELVINYDLPKAIDEYVHRIGRTGRLGNTGRAISFYDSVSDAGLAGDLVKILSDAQQIVPEWLVAEGRRNPYGLNGNASGGSSFGGKDVRAGTDHDPGREEWK